MCRVCASHDGLVCGRQEVKPCLVCIEISLDVCVSTRRTVGIGRKGGDKSH